ncbi:hypothetical protein F5Y03DRAFT_245302 [Xylaria venustula]|nr:hypothetical protein F5Y03DRAFT_245302 [Xylaria venustula]
MLAMTRLPSDSFVPSGGIDSFDRSTSPIPRHNAQPASVISPLSLAHSIKQTYFDMPPSNYALPPSLSAVPGPGQHLSPDRNSLLTPTRGGPGSSVASPSMGPISPGSMSPFEHLSPQATATLLQRREEYSRRLLASWQAERAHLEASRARAEEMFREERDMMDAERLLWVEQKSELENEIMRWKQSKEAADAEVIKLTKLLEGTCSGDGKFGGGLDGAASENGGHHGQGNSVGRKIGGTSSTTFRSPSDGVSPSSLPPGRGSTIPESNPFVPLDPRMQSVPLISPATDKERERVPSIEINEVIPGLEGVRLRAPAIQKPTFHDQKPPLPTTLSDNASPSELKKGSSPSQPKFSPAVLTQEALKAPEHHRLTMHAGHTPNHSMSFSQLPTLESTTGNTAGSTGTSTPTSPDGPKIAQGDGPRDSGRPATIPDAKAETSMTQALRNDAAITEEPIYEPSDEDPALKGPLCLKNRPAADEIFLRRLSDKLEEVRATDATPSVLSESAISELPDVLDVKAIRITDDDTNNHHSDDALEEVEADVPLRLKSSSNFGQPLGQARRTFSN